eukprot:TRINITY_DN12435_c0_g1_i1.p1 TRINITY_DN12435_c0_g1~~TRINITY_DN12435_c0_g1_i1.p1  ORF type:complete len:264 (+),score=22.73 TRINITY_DN12435_c0_g1_i1:26-793(+)
MADLGAELNIDENSRFYPLLRFFKGVLKDDLKNFTRSEVIQLVGSEEKLLMKIFVDDVLAPYLRANPGSSVGIPLKFTVPQSSLGILDLNGRIISSKLPIMVGGSICITLLKAELEKNIDLKTVKVLRFARCNLFDEDAPIILDLVKSMENCTFIDLSHNRLYGELEVARNVVDPALRSLLSLPQVTVVNITGNPLATVNRKDFFISLSPEQAEKLIFIPAEWVENGGWKVLVPGNEKIVEEAHAKYYSNNVRLW